MGNRIASPLYLLCCKHGSRCVSVHKNLYTHSHTSRAVMCRIALRNKARYEFALIRVKQGLVTSLVFILGRIAPCKVRLWESISTNKKHFVDNASVLLWFKKRHLLQGWLLLFFFTWNFGTEDYFWWRKKLQHKAVICVLMKGRLLVQKRSEQSEVSKNVNLVFPWTKSLSNIISIHNM